jgi:transglutaminase-like putative cysteine protease
MNGFFFTTSALITLGLVALLLAELISWPIFLVIAALTALSPFRDRLGLDFSRITINIAVLGFGLALLVSVFYFGADPKYQLLYFSLSLLVAKLYGPKAYRDHLQIFLIALFHLIAATLNFATMGYLLVFLLFLAIGIAYLMVLNIRRDHEWCLAAPSAEEKKRREKSTREDYRLPAEMKPLFHWSFLLRVLACFAAIVLVSTPVFFLIPRFTLRFLASSSKIVELNTGFAEQVELGDLGQLIENDLPVMKVYVKAAPPRGRLGLRWRGITLDEFDGSSWRVSEAIHDEDSYAFSTNFAYPFETRGPANSDQRIELQPIDTHMVFVPPEPAWIALEPFAPSVPFPPPGVQSIRFSPVAGNYSFSRAHQLDYVEFKKTVHRRFPSEEEGWRHFRRIWSERQAGLTDPIAYRVRSFVQEPGADELRGAQGADPETIRRYYLQLPEGMEGIALLARQIGSGIDNRYDQALAIERYLREEYTYSLVPPPGTQGMSLDDFLFNYRQGHCEYFSAAMGVMLRSLGIPARVANGFVAGEYNPFGEYYQIRQSDAHSWVEAYFPGFGWVPFDPTPPRAARGWNPLRTIVQIFDAAQSGWVKYVVDFSFQEQRKLFGGLFRHLAPGVSFEGFAVDLATGQRSARNLVVNMLIAAIGLILALFGIFFFVFSGSARSLRSKAAKKKSNAQLRSVIEFYTQFLRIMARKGFRHEPAQTPGEFAEAIEKARPAWAGPVKAITRLYYAIRFGEQPLDAAVRRTLSEQLKALRRL